MVQYTILQSINMEQCLETISLLQCRICEGFFIFHFKEGTTKNRFS